MVDDNSDSSLFYIIFFIVFVFAIPLFAPEVFVITGLIAWPIIYLGMWIASFGFDATTSLPWYFSDHFSVGLAVIQIFILAGIGLFIRGVIGTIAMVITWFPLLLMPGFLISIGVGTNEPWDEYKELHYMETKCIVMETGGDWCTYNPKENKNLPSFIEDNDTNKIIRVIGYH